MTSGIAPRLRRGTVLGAEGYVFELERRGYIKAGPYVPEVVLDFPGAVAELHREFLRAGADVMVALTYYAHREKLRDVGRENDLEAMNRQAVRIARQVAAEGDALVAGNVCNTWAYDPDDPSTAATVRAMYAEQLGWAALALEPFACTRFEMADFARAARDLGVNYVGICCGAGPHHVRAMAEALGREVPASAYSPALDLHPMFRGAVAARNEKFSELWNA